jgi:hypothetical protein
LRESCRVLENISSDFTSQVYHYIDKNEDANKQNNEVTQALTVTDAIGKLHYLCRIEVSAFKNGIIYRDHVKITSSVDQLYQFLFCYL